MKTILAGFCILVLFFTSCSSIQSKNTIPEGMETIEETKTSIINRFWLTKPATFEDYQRGAVSIVDNAYFNEEVKIVGKIKYEPKSFFETGTVTDLYVGYNESVGYIYGYVSLVNEDLKDIQQNKKQANAEMNFNEYYNKILAVEVKQDELNKYKQIGVRADQVDLIKGEKVFLDLVPKKFNTGGSDFNSASNFTIYGNPIYSEVANSIVLINFACVGSSPEVSSILNGYHPNMLRAMIWGTVIETSTIDPIIQVNYITCIIPGLSEKLLKVDPLK